jgi:hypothetical protein
LRYWSLRLAEFLQDGSHPTAELIWGKRLEDIFNGPGGQTGLDFRFLPFGGKKDHRNWFQRINLFHFSACLITCHSRHTDIHHDQVGVDFLGFEESFFPICSGNHFVPGITQGKSDQVSDIGFVFCN